LSLFRIDMRILLVFSIILFTFPDNINGQVIWQPVYPDSISGRRLAGVVATGGIIYAGGISALSYFWYKDQERVPFHFYNDTRGYLQMDKAGHFYAAYHQSFFAYKSLRWAGVSHKNALFFGGPMGLVFQTPIEIFDGLYKGYGFSIPDMLANTLGVLMFTMQQAFLNEQIAIMKFSYSPSPYPKYYDRLGGTHLERFVLDYNAHTYWFSGNVKKLTGIAGIPSWFNIAVGYSANGMLGEFENPQFYRGKPLLHFDRYRQFLISPDIDFTKIKTRKKWVYSILQTANLIKIPFPAVEFNSFDGFRFRALYY
jgi:hypothetical protein